jgi:type IV pilus assembly protein PilQ
MDQPGKLFNGLRYSWLSVVLLLTLSFGAASPISGEPLLAQPTTPPGLQSSPVVTDQTAHTRETAVLQNGAILVHQNVTKTSPATPSESLPSPEPDPALSRQFTVPLAEPALDSGLQISVQDELISLVARGIPLNVVLTSIAQQHGLNLVTSNNVQLPVSVTLTNVSLQDALNSILTVNGYTWHLYHDIIMVTSIESAAMVSPLVQGRELRVFSLNFSSPVEINRVVQGLLSPAGQSFVSETDSTNKMKTRQQLVVEDLPEYLTRIEAYIAQADCPPRQVLIEAHVLQVDLKDDLKHGVNLKEIFRIANSRVTFETTGFADPNASPAFLLHIKGTDLNALVEALKTTTDAKTLASPKVLVLNGQEARIQVGEQLGFFVTTTTQTSTLQDVQFLDVGVVLRVTPIISNDGRVVMTVKPEVSHGQINPITTLPEEETTEVETTVMLNDGYGMVIGGLIKETDREVENKVPWLGDLPIIGRAFQQRTVKRERHEVIIALIPHIIPLRPCVEARQQTELRRATTPLLVGPLYRADRRRWEPELLDAIRNPINCHHPCPPQRVRIPYDLILPPTFDGCPNTVETILAPDVSYNSSGPNGLMPEILRYPE